MTGVAKRNCDQQRDADLCGVNRSKSRSYGDKDSNVYIRIKGGTVSEG
jgi:hypothetical protein